MLTQDPRPATTREGPSRHHHSRRYHDTTALFKGGSHASAATSAVLLPPPPHPSLQTRDSTAERCLSGIAIITMFSLTLPCNIRLSSVCQLLAIRSVKYRAEELRQIASERQCLRQSCAWLRDLGSRKMPREDATIHKLFCWRG